MTREEKSSRVFLGRVGPFLIDQLVLSQNCVHFGVSGRSVAAFHGISGGDQQMGNFGIFSISITAILGSMMKPPRRRRVKCVVSNIQTRVVIQQKLDSRHIPSSKPSAEPCRRAPRDHRPAGLPTIAPVPRLHGEPMPGAE